MGKEISYCHTCGRRLLETEPAFILDHRRFCKPCSPANAVPKASRRQSSTRVRAVPAPAPKFRETTRVPSALPAVGAVAAVLAVGIAIAASGAPTPQPTPVPAVLPPQASAESHPKPVVVPSIDDTLSRIREIRQSDLMFERREEVLGLLKDAAARSGPRLEEVDQIAAEYDRKFEQAAARLADFTRSEAMRMAAKEKVAEAIERLEAFPAAFRTSKSADQIGDLRRDLERRRAASAAPIPAPPQKQVVGRS